MTYWAISALINGIASAFLGLLVYSRDVRAEKNQSYGLFCLSLFVWSLFYFLWQISTNQQDALFWSKALMAGATFIPISYLHHIYSLIGQTNKYRFRIYLSYLFGAVSAVAFFDPLFIKGVSSKLSFKFWPDAGPLFLPFLIVWFLFVFLGVSVLIRRLSRQDAPLHKEQLRYVLIATIIGWAGGATNFPLWFGIKIYPVGNILATIYVSIVAYAIVKYRLMDIRLAITSVGIFLGIYAFALGIPFYLHVIGFKMLALCLAILLATFAPFIYSRFKKQAEDRILEEQRTYQDILLKASQGLTRLKKVEEISHFVVTVILRTIRIKSAGFYLFDGQKFHLKDREGDVTKYAAELAGEHPVVNYLRIHGAVFLDEIKQDTPNSADAMKEMRAFFREHPAQVAVAVMRDSRVFGLMFLGEKANNTSYSERDLSVINVIADQTALAMENAIHLEMTKKDFIEQMHDRRLKDVGLLGSTISHQMCNRLQKITLALEYAQSVFDEKALANDTRETLVTKLRESLRDFEMMKREALSAADISDALKTFSKSGTEPTAVPLKRVVKMAKDLVEAKHKGLTYGFEENYAPDLHLWVNISSMQDVLFNAFDNSLDAIKIKRQSQNCPPDYAPLISVKAYANGTTVTVEVTDNGVGFRPENLEKVFIPFFTTKGTMEGTGLGLHAMRELVRRNSGDIMITSEFFQWTRVTINLPLATEERISAAAKQPKA